MPFKLSKTELKELRKIAEAIDYEVNPPYPNRFGEWVRISQRASVYKNKKRGLVVKRPNFIYSPMTPLKVRVPTIKLDKFGWVVQPFVARINTKRACALIRKQLGNFVSDLHHLNVGWYKGKPVMFDW